jgi:hypothetical protein
VSIIQEAREEFHVWTDASGKKGIGGHYNHYLFAAHVPRRHRRKHINCKEMYAVLHALILWHEHWKNGKLIIHCDNQSVVDSLNKKSIRGNTINPLQTLLLLASLLNIDIVAISIPTAENAIADALSRHDFKRLANLGYKDYAQIHRATLNTRISTFRQKLFSSFKIALPPQHEKATPMLSITTNTLQNPTTTVPSPPPSRLQQTGLPISSRVSKQVQPDTTLMGSAITTLNTASQLNNSMTHLLSECFVEQVDSTIRNKNGNDSPSQKTSSSRSLVNSERNTSVLTKQMSMQRSASALQPSSAQASSRGKNGILFNLLDSVYPVST